MNASYLLPDWDFVAGATQRRSFILYKNSGELCDIQGGTAHLAIVEYVHQGAPVITKEVAVGAMPDGKKCRIAFTLSPSETKDLDGKYLYQVMVKDGNGNVSIPFHGHMRVQKNLQKSAIV